VPVLSFKKLDAAASTPTYANPGDGGADLYALHGIVLWPGGREAVRTGIAVAIPDGYAGLVLPRSGLARKHGVTLANAPGLVDAGYRGELVCVMVNHGKDHYIVQPGDRIGQLMIVPIATHTFEEVAELPESQRGAGGFGSSGR
jgi:dUTP pyrophosphatase